MNINACRVFQTSVHDAHLGWSDELEDAKRLETPESRRQDQPDMDLTRLCSVVTKQHK